MFCFSWHKWSEDKNESGLLTTSTDSHKWLPHKTMEPLDFSRRSGKVFLLLSGIHLCVKGIHLPLYTIFIFRFWSCSDIAARVYVGLFILKLLQEFNLLICIVYSMWTKVIPFPPSSLYISYKTIYFHNILMKSFLIGFSWNF